MLKNKMLAVAAAVVVSVSANATDLNKDASYVTGAQLGYSYLQNKEIQKEFFKLDDKVVLQAIKDVIDNKVDQKQLEKKMIGLKNFVQEKAQKEAKETLESGKKYQEKFAKEKGVVKTKSGLLYKIVKQGSGDFAKLSDTLKVNYEGKLVNGKVFDSSYARKQPAEFPLKGVIKGWQEGLPKLKKGGKMELVIPAELGYGTQALPNIPANSTLIFTVELLDIKK